MDFSLRNTRIGLALAFLVSALFVTVQDAQSRESELRPVRATIGCIEYRNWQSGLVNANPNLRHYHWNPIYANVQGVRLVGPPPPSPQRLTSRPKKQVLANKPQKNDLKRPGTTCVYKAFAPRPSVYRKPVHIAPTHRVGTGTNLAYRHSAPMRNTNTSLAYRHASPQGAQRDMMGRLVPKHPTDAPITATELDLRHRELMGRLMPPQSPGLAAKQKKLQLAEKSVSGTLSTRNVNGVLSHKEVEGQLVARAVSATLADPVAAYSPYSRGDGMMRRQTRAMVDGRVTRGSRNY